MKKSGPERFSFMALGTTGITGAGPYSRGAWRKNLPVLFDMELTNLLANFSTRVMLREDEMSNSEDKAAYEERLADEYGRQAREDFGLRTWPEVEGRVRRVWEQSQHRTPWSEAQRRVRAAWSNFSSS